jgi:hypothetical protein
MDSFATDLEQIFVLAENTNLENDVTITASPIPIDEERWGSGTVQAFCVVA